VAQENGKLGAVAAGHEETARVAAACVAEPVLASLDGGGFFLAYRADAPDEAIFYDFFTQTPKQRRPMAKIEFLLVLVDFGAVTWEFHIVGDTCATPGMVAGLSTIRGDLCRMSPVDHFAHAIQLARGGAALTTFTPFFSKWYPRSTAVILKASSILAMPVEI
jgi:gamma-glutamyltranspeptidase/glutathione hydrolase